MITATTGLDALAAVRDGLAPPPAAAELLGLDLVLVDPGHTAFTFRPGPRFGNGLGAVHGGILATVADFAVTTAVRTMLPVGIVMVTASLNVAYLRPVDEDGEPIRADGRVLRLGRSLAHAVAELTGSRGVYATATAVCPLVARA